MTYNAKTTLSDALNQADGLARQVVAQATDMRTRAQNGTATYTQLHDYLTSLTRQIGEFNTISGMAGMVQYAKDQKADQAYDVGAAFTEMVSATTDARDWLDTNLPLGADNYLEEFTRDPTTHAKITRIFTAGQTTSLVTMLTALLSSIEV